MQMLNKLYNRNGLWISRFSNINWNKNWTITKTGYVLFTLLFLTSKDIVAQTFLKSVKKYSYNTLPEQYKSAALKSLANFQEINLQQVTFCIKPSLSPLKTTIAFTSIFKKAKDRKYKITISNKTATALMPILFTNLSDSAEIGVLGHEYSHIADMQGRNFFGLLKLAFAHLSKKQIDKQEYYTDGICIDHGMAAYLLAWSKEVRTKLSITNWRGANNFIKGDTAKERYRNPETITQSLK